MSEARAIETYDKSIGRVLVYGVSLLPGDLADQDDERDWYFANLWNGTWVGEGDNCIQNVTHWMPVPPPPQL